MWGDSLDGGDINPDFQILISAALSFGEFGHKGSREAMLGKKSVSELVNEFSNEKNVHELTPPAFIVHASDDPVVNPMNSILYYPSFKGTKN